MQLPNLLTFNPATLWYEGTYRPLVRIRLIDCLKIWRQTAIVMVCLLRTQCNLQIFRCLVIMPVIMRLPQSFRGFSPWTLTETLPINSTRGHKEGPWTPRSRGAFGWRGTCEVVWSFPYFCHKLRDLRPRLSGTSQGPCQGGERCDFQPPFSVQRTTTH